MAKRETFNEELLKDSCGYFSDKLCEMNLFDIPPSDYCAKELSQFYETIDTNKGDYIQKDFYERLLLKGYRRSGQFFYSNICPSCQKCIPIRIEAKDFVPTKSQRHSLRKNSGIQIKVVTDPAQMVTQEKQDLYRQYYKRHNPKLDHELMDSQVLGTLLSLNGLYTEELLCLDKIHMHYAGTINIDYYDNGKLVGVSVLDCGSKDALSSNYFYYDISPEELKKGLGTYSILREIQYCVDNNIKYYYLGYYIKECNKMNYKANFQPCQLYINNEWRPFSQCTEEELTGKY